jgi:hypothetical protein
MNRQRNEPTRGCLGEDNIFIKQVAMDKGKRDNKIIAAEQKYGYTQQQIADRQDMHYSTISNLVLWKA